jgi:hypothetical protein
MSRSIVDRIGSGSLSAWRIGWLALLMAACPLTAWAQLPAARLNSVFPAGGKQGTTFDVTLGGSDLDDLSKMHFSHPGITAVQKTNPAGPFDKGPQPVDNQFTVTIAPDVPVGMYEARAIGRFGISSARVFSVGQLPESAEKEPNNTREQASEVAINSVVNGATGGGADIDYFKIKAAKGQRILVDCWGQRIDSRLDGTLAVFDAAGNELATSRDANRRDPLLDFTPQADGEYVIKLYDFVYGGSADYFYRLVVHTGPHIDFIFPPSGVPGTTSKFTLFGRNLPGGQPADGVKIDGRPLEKLTVDVAVPSGAATEQLQISALVESEDSGLDGFEYRLSTPKGVSNPILLGFATGTVVAEDEPNDDAKKPQKIELPCEYVGQFQKRGDHDWLTFEAKKGDTYMMEVISKRQGVHTDPQLLVQQVTVNDKKEGTVKDLQEADDFATNLGGTAYDTRCDDPIYRFVAPADGTYRVMICDLYQRGDPRYLYRLSLRKESPDFRLVAVPHYLSQQNNKVEAGVLLVRKGGNVAVNVLAFRRDGFEGEITVSASGLPAGVSCPEVILGGDQGSALLVFTAAEDAAAWAGTVQLVGKAKIGDAEVTREARGGSAIWPPPNAQNARAEARLTRNIALAVSEAETAPFQVVVAENKVYEMSRAGKLEIPIKVARREGFKANLQLNPGGLPKNTKAANVTIDGGKSEGKLIVDLAANAPLGTYTIFATAQGQVSYKRNPEAQTKAQERKKEIDKALAAAKDAEKKAAQEKTAADKAATETAAEAKKTADAKTAAEKKAAELNEAAKKADEKAKAAAEAAMKESDNQALAEAKAAAEKAAAEAAAKAKEAAEALSGADKMASDAAAKAKAAAEAKTAADKAAADAAEKVKAATAAQAAADKEVKAAANSAKANNVNLVDPSTPIVIKVTATPITLAPLPQALEVKQGGKVEAPVAITRLYGYADPVEIEVTPPKDAKGLKIPKATIAKDQSEAKVVIEAAADARPGDYTVAIKGTAKFNGQNLPAEQTFVLKVVAAEADAQKK